MAGAPADADADAETEIYIWKLNVTHGELIGYSRRIQRLGENMKKNINLKKNLVLAN